MDRYESIKHDVLDRISSGEAWTNPRRAMYVMSTNNDCRVHVRFCPTDHRRDANYKFDIYPYTLTAQYEVWICGDASTYYLIPMTVIRQIYEDPDRYTVRRNPTASVVSINIANHTVIYAAGGKTKDLSPFYRKILD